MTDDASLAFDEKQKADPGYPRLCLVSGMYMCEACLDGIGGECHTPGCILWINRAPDLAIRDTIIECGGTIEVLVSRLEELREVQRKGGELNEEERALLAREKDTPDAQ
ncbi:hypothetical protein LCGC14_1957030 [marine sediment metagenome]|uniref:Uncharacterized protein n=1 Tax=marine sediment metagenome TaxID=412755 RepID=A0A0F9ICT5_9ZZZZ